jgi:L-arabinose isomerase
MPYLFFRPDSGVQGCVTRWLESGGTHHEAVVQGDRLPRIRQLCRMLGVELIEV